MLVITGGSVTIVIARVALPVPPALIALMVASVMPPTVVVPLISPVVVFTLNPAGNPVALKLVGLLLAVIEYANAYPSVPVAFNELVITGTGGVTVNVAGSVVLPRPFTVFVNVIVSL